MHACAFARVHEPCEHGQVCGGAHLDVEPEALARAFRVDRIQGELPFTAGERFPGQTSPIVIEHVLPDARRERVLGSAQWGLIPHWASDPSIGHKLFNARAETLTEKPAFRESFALRRCVVPVSAFYEWHGTRGHKQRYTFHAPDGSPLALAGLWAQWKRPDRTRLVTFTIITVDANESVAAVHPRMPALLAPEEVDLWLERETPSERLKALLRPSPVPWLVAGPG